MPHTEARQAELKAAFERVENKINWKMPIDAIVRINNLDEEILIHDAVVHFAGCVPKFHHYGNRMFNVTAIGYYAAVGA